MMSLLIRENHVHLPEARGSTTVAHGIDLLRLALAVAGEALVLPKALVANAVERSPEVGRTRLVNDARNHSALLAALDLPKSVAAELEVVALVVDGPRAAAVDENAVVHSGDQVVQGR